MARLPFNSANPGSHAGFRHDAEQPDLSGMTAMGAAAELLAEGFDRDDSHLFTVLVAEEGQSALGHGVLNAHDLRLHSFVSPDFTIDHCFDFVDVP